MKNENVKRVMFISGFCAAVFVLTRIALQFGTVANAPTVGFTFLILVLLSAFFADIVVAVATSVVAASCFNFFFLPPVGTFTIASLDDWISFVTFLMTAIAISRLTASARHHAVQARKLDGILSKLKEFGAWLISMPQDRISLSSIAEQIVILFSMEYCSIHVYSEGKWHHFTGVARKDISNEIAGRLKYVTDHPTNVMELVDENSLGVRYQQINQGTDPVALLAIKTEEFPASALNALAYMIGVRLMEVLQDKPNTPLNLAH
jgi:two-component system, OmpR family, sensor histidine kinase KdpD